MKKGLLILVLGLVLVMTGMGESAQNSKNIPKYPNLISTMIGTWKTARHFGLNGDFAQWGLELVITNQDGNGNFYGELYGLPIDETVSLTGTIASNKKDVTMTMIPPPQAGISILVRFEGQLSGTSANRKLSGVLTSSVSGGDNYTETGKIFFILPPTDIPTDGQG